MRLFGIVPLYNTTMSTLLTAQLRVQGAFEHAPSTLLLLLLQGWESLNSYQSAFKQHVPCLTSKSLMVAVSCCCSSLKRPASRPVSRL